MEANDFKGRIAPYHWDAEAHWPAAPEPPADAPNVVVVLLDDVGFAQLGCFGSDIATPTFDRLAARRSALHQLPHHRAVLPHPGLRAHRPQPPQRRHGSHHRARHRLPRLRRPHPPLGRVPPRDAHARTATRPTPSASGTSRPRTRPTSAPAASAGRSGRGFERFYGFFEGETHQYAPALVHDNHQVPRPEVGRGRLPPHRGPRRPRHRVPRRPAPRRSRQAVLPLRRHRRVPLAPPGARRVDRALPRRTSTRGGTCGGSECLARQKADGIAPRVDRAVANGPSGCRRGTPCPTGPAPSTPASWRRSPRSCPTPTTRSAGSSTTSSATGELDNTIFMVLSDNGACSEGGPGRLAERHPHLERAWPSRWTRRSSGSTRSAGPGSTTTTRGAGRWRATRRSGAGSARSTRVAWPTRSSCTGRAAWATVGDQGCAASTCTPSTSSPPSSRPSGSMRPRPSGA